ncbi:MAG: tRNA (adenosine(37)-N6)-threonylcarbamoyltransferase complex ATPase subunit type 1 TsaE [Candidatus Cloacimonadales bacterium]|jgi:tRNA threonylcarbamoyl adenosine modification protein YjeE|nr:tRNA (adenosine(37)-N6)-threonylcarbamoyltransferase complex ATPase subunit type 1 TsaE [Candidatus Cloacimonadota bacterium]MDY0381104.1 tRNA (adenosine(37)-N6)-threonylcarbamoyltransferase complex ATPase subunit type 1 TsaE [Candidatus Cloacimonadaceae bacterium]HCM16190.1 tRNA (adenosine(37)-N6)-threonylcarbamoyltransferase complex ATPase subunit type 1 TsaE [Candidatus Cloacimonas sp.]MCB5256061.1 tRNA (adenosine(37)-N6)-threonylcarbamoyltransferase complex ATPase subunit type 1 TsaE [Can
MRKRIDLNSEQDTIDLAHYIAPLLGPGSVVTLAGELGSGKTFFVKALGAFLGVPDEIDSPSFVIFKEYHCGRYPFYHLDLYRLKHEDELLDLGLLDMIENGITIIEWPEVAENFLPYQNLRLYFGFEAKQRYVEIDADEKLQEYFN